MPGKFVLERGRTGKVRFSLRSTNGRVVFTSGTYDNRRAAKDVIAAIQRLAPGATVVEPDAESRGASASRTSRRTGTAATRATTNPGEAQAAAQTGTTRAGSRGGAARATTGGSAGGSTKAGTSTGTAGRRADQAAGQRTGSGASASSNRRAGAAARPTAARARRRGGAESTPAPISPFDEPQLPGSQVRPSVGFEPSDTNPPPPSNRPRARVT
jgi:uncharacterized protein YegP (UPF0339 family)